MAENIVRLLREKDLSYIEIKRLLRLSDEELTKVLDRLINDGVIILTKKEKYKLVELTDLRKGRIRIKNNHAIFDYNGKEIEIIPNYLNGASDNDIVLVSKDGKVARILKKFITYNALEVVIINDKKYVKYNNVLLELIGNIDDIDITSGYMILGELQDNNKVLLKEKIGQKDEIDMDVTPFIYEYDCNYKFSDKSIQQLQALPKYISDEYASKLIKEEDFVDLRDEVCITIDDKSTNDIDDGLMLKEDENYYYLTTVIAMPGYFVKRNSSLYYDVVEHGTSCYPAGMAIHMNHPILSKELCSLNENSTRLAMCYNYKYSKVDAKCKKVEIKLGIINSNKKMTYQAVNSIFEDNIIPEGYNEYLDLLKGLNSLSKILGKDMINKGFIHFYNPELKITYNNNETILDKRVNHTGENLIENLMLASNRDLTEYLDRKGLHLIYRVDEKANQEKLSMAMNFLATKLPIKPKEHYSKSDIISVINMLKNTPYEKVYNSMLIRCMSRAEFSTINKGHDPIGFRIYGQHTSPIRRCDLINQMIILDYLKYGAKYTNELWEDDLEGLVQHFNERELKAESLEQRVEKRKVANSLRNLIGETKQGIISSVTDFGFYVEIDEMYEGLVNKSSLKGDIVYSPEMFSLFDKKNNISYTLGDQVTVVIKGITDNDEIDFTLQNTLEYNNLYGENYDYKKEKGKTKKKVL